MLFFVLYGWGSGIWRWVEIYFELFFELQVGGRNRFYDLMFFVIDVLQYFQLGFLSGDGFRCFLKLVGLFDEMFFFFYFKGK